MLEVVGVRSLVGRVANSHTKSSLMEIQYRMTFRVVCKRGVRGTACNLHIMSCRKSEILKGIEGKLKWK